MTPEELQKWFKTVRALHEASYLTKTEPWRQSGMSGPEDRWTALRKCVADCIDRDGTFLDVGCANGYLIECCLRWTAERGIRIDPYGVDVSAPLLELAKERLPLFRDHLFLGNAFEWVPPFKFDFVRTELVYVPAEFERAYVDFLLEHAVKPGGRLLVANYMEDHPTPEIGLVPENYPTRQILDRFATLGLESIGYKDGYDVVKGRRTRIAILEG